jgi:hypothetical protein
LTARSRRIEPCWPRHRRFSTCCAARARTISWRSGACWTCTGSGTEWSRGSCAAWTTTSGPCSRSYRPVSGRRTRSSAVAGTTGWSRIWEAPRSRRSGSRSVWSG